MRKHFLHIVLFILLAASLSSCMADKNKLPDLRERYGPMDTKPFGAYTAFRMLSNVYPDKFVIFSKKSFAKFYKETQFDSSSLYINISNKYYVNDADAQALLDFVYDGHTAFISATELDTVLMAKLFSKQVTGDFFSMFAPEKYRRTSVSLLPDEFSTLDSFSFFYRPFSGYFSEIHGERGRVTGYNDEGKPNFMVFFWGKGRLYLHCAPRALSNYFLLSGNNHLYMKQIMQMMTEKPGNIFYDDFYNKKNFRQNESKSFSALDEILKHPALAIAFWISLALLLLYIFFGGKRKQRIVPVIAPVTNTSIAFTEAVAGLYLSEKSNKNIADKMISHFSEYIRTRYFLHLNTLSKDLITALSKKSGVATEDVQSLYNTIQQVGLAHEVSDFELLALNEQIQMFYKKRN